MAMSIEKMIQMELTGDIIGGREVNQDLNPESADCCEAGLAWLAV